METPDKWMLVRITGTDPHWRIFASWSGGYTQGDSWRLNSGVVRECLEACSRANEIRHFVPPTQEQVVLSCMREIKQHFGVEE